MSELKAARRSVTLAYSRHNRRRKARFALDFARQHDVRTVLLVGVSYVNHPHENLVENALLDSGMQVTPSGVGEHVEGWPGYVVADGRALPFDDQSFDLVYSNAVIEHVGGRKEQQRFVDEMHRVGRSWILTTPNRWFPIEAHYDHLFRHWRSDWVDPTGSVTRLLSPATLRQLLPPGAGLRSFPLAPTLTATRTR